MSVPKSKMVWYPCRHSERSGAFWDYRATVETGTLMHEEGNRKNPVRCCKKCAATAKSGKKRKKH